MNVFVTVGTTSFEGLVRTLTDSSIRKALVDKGYRHVTIQFGRGAFEPPSEDGGDLTVECYRYKDSISLDVERADLVISHAGAGSCMEVLGAGKPLIVVVNEDLMSNHQLELARKLHSDGHVVYCNCSTLLKTIQELNVKTLKPFPAACTENFSKFMDIVLS